MIDVLEPAARPDTPARTPPPIMHPAISPGVLRALDQPGSAVRTE